MSDFFRRHSAGFLLSAYVVFSIICLTNRIDPYVQGVKTVMWFLIRPTVVTSGEYFNRIDFLKGRLFRLFRAEGENFLLREQLSEMSVRELERDALEAENSRLRSLLSLKTKTFQDSIPAEVVGHDVQDWFYSLTLNKGGLDGVSETAAVVGGGPDNPALVGRILELDETTSKVLLVTDPVSAVSVRIDPSGDLGLLEGRSEPTLVVRYLSSRATVKPGDEVTTEGLGGVFPPGVPVGRVTRVYRTPDRFFIEAVVEPYVDLSSLREVLILERSVAPHLEAMP